MRWLSRYEHSLTILPKDLPRFNSQNLQGTVNSHNQNSTFMEPNTFSSGLHWHQVHIRCTTIHAGKTPIHIKELNQKKSLI